MLVIIFSKDHCFPCQKSNFLINVFRIRVKSQILNHFLIALFIFYDNESMKGQSDNNAKLVSRKNCAK